MITQDELKEKYHYDPVLGTFTSLKNGKVSGKGDSVGNIRIVISGKPYLAQKLAWLYVHGYIPKGHMVHKDGNRKNNSIDNLLTGAEAKKLFVERRDKKAMDNRLAGYDPNDKFTIKLMTFFDKNWRIHGRHLRRTEGQTTVYLLEFERHINGLIGRN